METFLKDIKHSLRMFRKNPGFTLAAITALLGSHAASEDQLLPMVRCVRNLEQREASELISMLRDINGTAGRPAPAGSLQGIS